MLMNQQLSIMISDKNGVKAGSTLTLSGSWKFVCFIETEIWAAHDLRLAQQPIAKIKYRLV